MHQVIKRSVTRQELQVELAHADQATLERLCSQLLGAQADGQADACERAWGAIGERLGRAAGLGGGAVGHGAGAAGAGEDGEEEGEAGAGGEGAEEAEGVEEEEEGEEEEEARLAACAAGRGGGSGSVPAAAAAPALGGAGTTRQCAPPPLARARARPLPCQSMRTLILATIVPTDTRAGGSPLQTPRCLFYLGQRAATSEMEAFLGAWLGSAAQVASYHAGMRLSGRCRVQVRWKAGVDLRVMTCTIAYGMGADAHVTHVGPYPGP